jgi:hypothetical protein
MIHDTIKNLLDASGPCTLEEILEEVRIQEGISRNQVLPKTLIAIVDLIAAGEICEYEQMPLEDPLEYAWELAEPPLKDVELDTANALADELIAACNDTQRRSGFTHPTEGWQQPSDWQ